LVLCRSGDFNLPDCDAVVPVVSFRGEGLLITLVVISTLRLFRWIMGILDTLDDVTGDVRCDVTGDVKGDVAVEGDGLSIPRLAFDACVELANEAFGFLPRVGLLSLVDRSVNEDSSSPLAFSGVGFWANIELILVDIGSGICFPTSAIVSAVLCVHVRGILGFGLRRAHQ
jgi:hypothetical protein